MGVSDKKCEDLTVVRLVLSAVDCLGDSSLVQAPYVVDSASEECDVRSRIVLASNAEDPLGDAEDVAGGCAALGVVSELEIQPGPVRLERQVESLDIAEIAPRLHPDVTARPGESGLIEHARRVAFKVLHDTRAEPGDLNDVLQAREPSSA